MNRMLKSKRVIVFGFEGKNNKTETRYFSHFKPKNNIYILKFISTGFTDPENMFNSIISKRKRFDYGSKDLTYIFVDGDCDAEKINKLQNNSKKGIKVIVSNPCFELWFLNHFIETTKEYRNNEELITDLKKYIPDYDKSKDYFNLLKNHTNDAIKNSLKQKNRNSCKTKTDVVDLLDNIIRYK